MTPSARSAVTGSGSGRVPAALLAALLLVLGWACTPSTPRFHRTFDSDRALVEEVLRALEAKDRTRLEALALSEEEFKAEAFPEMPAWRKIPVQLVWDQLQARSRYGLGAVLAYQGGRSYVLDEIRYHGEHTAYETFIVHRRPIVHVRDRETGERQELVLFGSILEHDRRYKLFSFNIDR